MYTPFVLFSEISSKSVTFRGQFAMQLMGEEAQELDMVSVLVPPAVSAARLDLCTQICPTGSFRRICAILGLHAVSHLVLSFFRDRENNVNTVER